jgi:RNA polymerase sigma-70 factor (ECF subfamily)
MSGRDDTTAIQGLVDRLQAGDPSARVALLESARGRLDRLSRKMLHTYPGVARWEQTDDVLQNALIRLDRALKAVAPPTALDFFRLAAAQIRRELIDLARRHNGPEGLGAHHTSHELVDPSSRLGGFADSTHQPDRLAEWAEFHEAVEALPDEHRETLDLLWYQGLSQAEAATTLGVAERTVNRRWIKARLRLSEALGGEPPV